MTWESERIGMECDPLLEFLYKRPMAKRCGHLPWRMAIKVLIGKEPLEKIIEM